MSEIKKTPVTLGSKAYSFTDPVLGINITRGEVLYLTTRQMSSRRVNNALNSGHLRIVTEDIKKVKKYTDNDINKLDKKLKKLINSGKTPESITKSFSDEEVVLLAKKNGIGIEKSDTSETIMEVLVEELTDSKSEDDDKDSGSEE